MRMFEIPVYAFTREHLKAKIDAKIEELKSLHPSGFKDAQSAELLINSVKFPYSVYEHNYIVGYIDISYSNGEIVFSIFKICNKEKVRWNTKKKYFFSDIGSNGLHFCINDMSNKEIEIPLDAYLDEIAQTYFPRRVIDRSIFNMLNTVLDYKRLFSGIRSNCS